MTTFERTLTRSEPSGEALGDLDEALIRESTDATPLCKAWSNTSTAAGPSFRVV